MRYLLAAALLLTACGPASDSPAAHDAHAGHAELAAPADPGMSVYQLTSSWTDQHAVSRTLGELAGRPQLVAMVYTSCAYTCPLVVADMKKIEAEFPEAGFVLVSIDPERDTPGRLLEFAMGSRLGAHWTLLNGSEDAVMETAAVLGVRYRRVSATDFMHSNVITLLDAQGRIVYQQEGLGDIQGMRAALQSLSS